MVLGYSESRSQNFGGEGVIKAEDRGNGVAVAITGSDMENIMNEFSAVVASLMQLVVGEDVPAEVAMLGIHTSVLTGMTKALNQFSDEDESDDDMMSIIREAMKKEHEGE